MGTFFPPFTNSKGVCATIRLAFKLCFYLISKSQCVLLFELCSYKKLVAVKSIFRDILTIGFIRESSHCCNVDKEGV